jgi:hypothetical protein
MFGAPMTAKELAENVFKLFMREPYDGYFNAKPDYVLKREIESLLSEALAEARKLPCAYHGRDMDYSCKKCRDISEEVAIAAERERCAKIADHVDHEDAHCQSVGHEIAEKIRAGEDGK